MSKILLGISDRWVPDSRVDAIADFSQRLQRSLLLVHVVYGMAGSGADPIPGERVIEQVASRLRLKGAKAETLILFSDDLGDAILRTAEDHHASMIILGLSDKGVLTRLIEGNVAQQIIRTANIPLLLLPHDWKSPI